MESFTGTYHRTPKGEGRVGSKKMAQETTRDGHVSEMIHDHSESAVKLLEPCKYPKTTASGNVCACVKFAGKDLVDGKS